MIATKSSTMPRDLLRHALLADGAVVAGAGLLLAVAAWPLADLFDLPVRLLRTTGLALLPYAGIVFWIATRERGLRRGGWTVVCLNLLWTAASLLLLATDWVNPSALGTAFIVAQAILVAVFAYVQVSGLRQLDGELRRSAS